MQLKPVLTLFSTMGKIDAPISHLPPGIPAAGQTLWHKVLGILCVVFGGGSALYAILSTVGQKAMARFSEQQMEFTGADPAAYRALMEEWSGPLTIMGAATSVVALVLLAGGVLLLLRKRTSGVVLKGWAGLKMLLLVVTTPVLASFQKANMDVAFAGALAGEGAEMAASGARIGLVVGLAVTVLWGLLLPVFVLIWFSRRKIREQVAFWS